MQFKIKLSSLIAALFVVFGTATYYSNEISAQKKTYKIGDRGPAGGWIFYDKGNNSGGWRYLEAAPEDQEQAEWGCNEKSIPGARGTAIGTGKANTAAIVKSCKESGIAAKVAVAYRGGGKSDWFLPSKAELNLMYENLHLAGVGGFAIAVYWSSSEVDANGAWDLYFGDSSLGSLDKNDADRVRAVRAF